MIERVAERRRDKRIDIALPVILENTIGVTRDVSTSGVFFWESGMFLIDGESIRFALERKIATGKLMRICRGIVVRTEPGDNDVGVAVRIIESKTEAVPDHLRRIPLLKLTSEQPPKITRRRDGELASAVERVSNWSKLLRNMALEAREELQGQEVLKWDIPSITDGAISYTRRVRVCSVTVLRLVSSVSRLPRRSAIPGGSNRNLDLRQTNGDIAARKNDSGTRVGEGSGHVNWQNLRGDRGIRIDLEVYLADSWQRDRTPDKVPLPRVVVRAVSVPDNHHQQQLNENCYHLKSYSDLTEAFEAFLEIAIEGAISVNLNSRPREG